MKSAVAAMERKGQSYKGVLYGQFMNTAQGPKVIEFNARFGDPEAMNVLALLTSDLSEICTGSTRGPSRHPLRNLLPRPRCASTSCRRYPDSPIPVIR